VVESRPALHAALQELAGFNTTPELGGVTREVFTPTYMRALSFLRSRMESVGLQTRVDAMGNLIGLYRGREPGLARVLSGSHFDTTLNAGRYDGVVGVLGAIEALAMLRERGVQPRRSIEVIGFAGEEPRFGLGCLGSRAMMGRLSRADLDRLRDREGTSLTDALRDAGLQPDALGGVRVNPEAVHAFVELHVEQGGILDGAGVGLGIVTAIAAAHDIRVTVRGTATHSGATPMRERHDALAGAIEALAEVEPAALASPSGTTVATVGVLQVLPGAVNVVPGEVRAVIDVRDSNLDARRQVVERVLATLAATCERRGLTWEAETVQENTPAQCSAAAVDAFREAATKLDIEHLEMTSGAYHDAVSFAPEVPIGMVFVPSEGGLSHCPEEYTAPADIDRGVAVLALALERLADSA
jgi:ureidoglycolate amidohydrolase